MFSDLVAIEGIFDVVGNIEYVRLRWNQIPAGTMINAPAPEYIDTI